MSSGGEEDEGDSDSFDFGPDPEKVSIGAAADTADDGDQRRCDLETTVSRWAALPTIGTLIVGHVDCAARGAVWLGERMAQYRIRHAEIEGRQSARREFERTQKPSDAVLRQTRSIDSMSSSR